MLDNSLDFSGVCTTPITKSKREALPGDVAVEVVRQALLPAGWGQWERSAVHLICLRTGGCVPKRGVLGPDFSVIEGCALDPLEWVRSVRKCTCPQPGVWVLDRGCCSCL